MVQAELTRADGHGERKAALEMIERHAPGSTRHLTLAADKGYGSADFAAELRRMVVTPHVAQKSRHFAIDARTTRHHSTGTGTISGFTPILIACFGPAVRGDIHYSSDPHEISRASPSGPDGDHGGWDSCPSRGSMMTKLARIPDTRRAALIAAVLTIGGAAAAADLPYLGDAHLMVTPDELEWGDIASMAAPAQIAVKAYPFDAGGSISCSAPSPE